MNFNQIPFHQKWKIFNLIALNPGLAQDLAAFCEIDPRFLKRNLSPGTSSELELARELIKQFESKKITVEKLKEALQQCQHYVLIEDLDNILNYQPNIFAPLENQDFENQPRWKEIADDIQKLRRSKGIKHYEHLLQPHIRDIIYFLGLQLDFEAVRGAGSEEFILTQFIEYAVRPAFIRAGPRIKTRIPLYVEGRQFVTPRVILNVLKEMDVGGVLEEIYTAWVC